MTAKAIKPETLGGFLDFLPDEMIARQPVIEAIRRVYERFGFLPLDTPCMERPEVLLGDTTKFNKSVFTARVVRGIEDRDEVGIEDANFMLRFDLTVPLARVVAAYPDLSKPFKRYQIGKVWRGERPQQGRYREFYQFDFDTIGSRSVLADAEVIQIMYTVMKELGLSRFLIRFSSRKILNGLAEVVGCGEKKTEFCRILDRLDRIGEEEVIKALTRPPDNTYDESALALGPAQADTVRRFLAIDQSQGSMATLNAVSLIFNSESPTGAAGILELSQIAKILETAKIPVENWQIDLSVARGLDYYTGPVFEAILLDAPEFGSVLSGGRFDGLSDRFMPGSDIPGVGASVGLDRLFAALRKLGLLKKARTLTTAFVTVFSNKEQEASVATAAKLREAGINTELYLGDESLRAQVAYATRQEIPYMIILGPDEVANDRVMFKNMVKRKQEVLTFDECLDRLRVATTSGV
ncbi:MAG: histidine--tRNA ligase [Candidatus Vogelbacteria bacterium]|nr:histidine--tRNA ligase [Candidatus Vogelbacteria bacterium]